MYKICKKSIFDFAISRIQYRQINYHRFFKSLIFIVGDYRDFVKRASRGGPGIKVLARDQPPS